MAHADSKATAAHAAKPSAGRVQALKRLFKVMGNLQFIRKSFKKFTVDADALRCSALRRIIFAPLAGCRCETHKKTHGTASRTIAGYGLASPIYCVGRALETTHA
jgi:hypothetical protein